MTGPEVIKDKTGFDHAGLKVDLCAIEEQVALAVNRHLMTITKSKDLVFHFGVVHQIHEVAQDLSSRHLGPQCADTASGV